MTRCQIIATVLALWLITGTAMAISLLRTPLPSYEDDLLAGQEVWG